MWVLGYAVVSHNAYAYLVPLALFAFFQWLNIPKLDQHLAAKYGEAFQEYRQRVKGFVPFVL